MTSILPERGQAEPAAYPAGFKLGVATAAYQIEGAWDEDGRAPSIWDTFCRVPGAVAGGDTGEVACDHYHRWEDDLDLMATLGIESYRFSIAWPRVQPDGRGALNAKGVAFYRRLVEGLLARGIEPVATLYHWDLPQGLQDAGGWAERATAERFAEYAAAMAGALGDVVPSWITHNEPWVVAFLGHYEGRKAPGVRDWATALRVAHHLLLSHGLAVGALRGHGDVGITLNLHPQRPVSDRAEDVAAARIADAYANRWFLDPVLRGSYPADMLELVGEGFGVRAGDLETIAQPLDFLGVNYYFPHRVGAAPDTPPIGIRLADPVGPLTTMGWEQDPSGLLEILTRIRGDYGDVPIYITENGAAFDDRHAVDGVVDDPFRVAYLRGHLAAVTEAAARGVDVRRYYAWSFLDNFEWEHGYSQRFGIVHVDYATQVRTPKRSALWYREHIAATREERR